MLVFGLAGCGGLYDVGSGEGQGGEAGAAGESTNGSGGSSSGSAGGSGLPGVGGSQSGVGGSQSGVGGSQSGAGIGGGAGTNAGGGSSGAPLDCSEGSVLPPELGEPSVVWERISLFLYDEVRAPLSALPETTTLEWVADQVEAVILKSQEPGEEPPAGLVEFIHGWLFPYAEGDVPRARDWANRMSLAPVSELFAYPDPVLLEPEFLSTHPSISGRGAFILRDLLCEDVGAPPLVMGPVVPQPGQTSRQALKEATSAPTCAGCHAALDPLGAGLGHYDAAGNYQETENGLPIDATGEIGWNQFSWSFDGAEELNQVLSSSPELRQCLAEKLVDFAFEQAFGETLPWIHLPIETSYMLCESAQHGDSFLRMLQAVAMTSHFVASSAE